jgi:DNA polymerase III delta prime subunit
VGDLATAAWCAQDAHNAGIAALSLTPLQELSALYISVGDRQRALTPLRRAATLDIIDSTTVAEIADAELRERPGGCGTSPT